MYFTCITSVSGRGSCPEDVPGTLPRRALERRPGGERTATRIEAFSGDGVRTYRDPHWSIQGRQGGHSRAGHSRAGHKRIVSEQSMANIDE